MKAVGFSTSAIFWRVVASVVLLALLYGQLFVFKRWGDSSVPVLGPLAVILAALVSFAGIWGPVRLAVNEPRIPPILDRDGAHLVGDILYEITDQDAVLLAAEQEIGSVEATLKGRMAQLHKLAAARRALLQRAGRPDDAPLARMDRLAAEHGVLLGQLGEARMRLAERKADLERRVQDVRTQAELVWQTHQLASIEHAAAGASVPVIGATFDLSDIQAELARIVTASERAAAAWQAESEVAAL